MFMSISFLIAMSIISLMPVLAQGATYHVAKTGSNENSCSQSTSEKAPKLTVNGGLACMKSGDTLYIKAGTYKEFINHSAIPSGSAGNHTVVSSFEDDPVTLMPSSGGGAGDVVWFYGQRYITLNGLIIDASNVPVQGIRFSNGAHHIRIINGEVKNAPDNTCIGTQDSKTHHFELINLKVHRCGADRYHHGIYLYGTDHIISYSEIYDITGHGIHLYASSKVNHRNAVYGNRVHNNASTGILIGSGDDNIVYNNVVWGNGIKSGAIGGIRIAFRNGKNNKIYNNTVYKNAGAGITIGKGSGNSVVQNNVLWKNGKDVVDDEGVASAISHNISIDPGFLDEKALDFKLNEGSAAIDAGIEILTVSQDVNGISRPYGGIYDVGAYEFNQSVEIDSTAPNTPAKLRIVP